MVCPVSCHLDGKPTLRSCMVYLSSAGRLALAQALCHHSELAHRPCLAPSDRAWTHAFRARGSVFASELSGTHDLDRASGLLHDLASDLDGFVSLAGAWTAVGYLDCSRYPHCLAVSDFAKRGKEIR